MKKLREWWFLQQMVWKGKRDLARMSGEDRLWNWFGLSRASFLTMPRVMMHAMPDDWQMQMAKLCEEWDATWNSEHLPTPAVMARDNRNTFRSWPSWVLNYRHPDYRELYNMRKK